MTIDHRLWYASERANGDVVRRKGWAHARYGAAVLVLLAVIAGVLLSVRHITVPIAVDVPENMSQQELDLAVRSTLSSGNLSRLVSQSRLQGTLSAKELRSMIVIHAAAVDLGVFDASFEPGYVWRWRIKPFQKLAADIRADLSKRLRQAPGNSDP